MLNRLPYRTMRYGFFTLKTLEMIEEIKKILTSNTDYAKLTIQCNHGEIQVHGHSNIPYGFGWGKWLIRETGALDKLIAPQSNIKVINRIKKRIIEHTLRIDELEVLFNNNRGTDLQAIYNTQRKLQEESRHFLKSILTDLK